MSADFDIVILGDYFFDQIFTGMPAFPELGREVVSEGLTATGGALFTTVVALKRLGARVGWLGTFGSDSYSRYVYELAEREGVDLSLVCHLQRPYQRVTTSVPYNGERAFITYTDDDLPDQHACWLRSLERISFRHVHVGGLMSPDDARPFRELTRSRGATFSMDCQDSPLLAQPDVCRQALALADIFLPNTREACAITGAETPDAALQALRTPGTLVIVKDGENGVWIPDGDEAVKRVPGIDAGPVIDTTGAGDCFNGGFLYGLICEDVPLEQCARYGNICGGLSVTGVGGADRAPTYEQLQQWLARIELG
jgi:sugar/nucleoside kinase (ribokinase family)